MNLELADKTVCITGGTSGIGLACAVRFAEEGCNVAICGKNPEKLRLAENELRKISDRIYAQTADVAVYDELHSFAENTFQKFSGLDIWINNAGLYPQGRLLDMAEEDWDRVFAVNLKPVFFSAKIVKPYMMKDGGVIINASSFASVMPSANSGAYAASKAAVSSLTKTLAAELAPFGIRVNGYIPGVVTTEMTKEVVALKGDILKSQIALNDFGNAEDVADAVLFLASRRAGYITGTFLEVSGGKFCVQNPDFAWKWIDEEKGSECPDLR